MRRFLIGLILLVVMSGLAGCHWYLIRRLVLEPELASTPTALGMVAIVCLGLCVVAHPIAERKLPEDFGRLLVWPATLWMGLAFWLLLLVAVSDGLLWLANGAAFADDGSQTLAVETARARALGVVGVASVLLVPAVASALAPPRLVRVAIRLPRWPKEHAGFRIVQISDIHIGAILKADFARRITERVNALDPDLVAVTGDLVDGPVERLGPEAAPFGDLRARHGVFFVTGNHDHYAGDVAWVDRLKELGMRVLRNERVAIELPGQAGFGFEVVGVDDYRSRRMPRRRPASPARELPEILEGLPGDRFRLLLAHDPADFKQAVAAGIDLQLSGHTHGGQIWPFKYFVRLATPFVAGLYHKGAACLYVSRGTGFWGPPMRLLAPAEITEIALLPGLGTPDPAIPTTETPT